MTDEIRTIPPKLTKIEWNALLDHALIVPASYIIYKVDTEYRAKNGLTGKIDYSGTDASTVIQAAIDALTNGGKIFIKSGTYIITNPIEIVGELTLEGENCESTILKLSNGANCNVFEYTGAAYIYFPTFKHLRIEGNKENNNAGSGIKMNDKACDGLIFDCFILSFKENNIQIDYSWNWRIINCCIEYAGNYGLIGGNFITDTKFLYNDVGAFNVFSIEKCLFFSNQKNALTVAQQIIECKFEHNGLAGTGYSDVVLGTARQNPIVIGNYFDGSNQSSYGVYVSANVVDAIITGNFFKDYQWEKIHDVGTNTKIFGNQGFVTENSGTATISASTSVVFAHGLVGTPTHVAVGFKTTGYGSWIWSADATNITITVAVSGTYDLTWDAEYKP